MTVDVAGVFLDALVQAVEQGCLRVNTRRNGHVFITPVFWFVTYPVGVGDLARWIRRRRDGAQYDFVRDEIVQALRSEGYLLGVGMGGTGKAMRLCDIRSGAWDTPLALNGLLIRADRLPWHLPVQPFDGTVALRTV